MKNHRDVCFAKDAGFIEFEGLDGSIKTGCPETPAFKNRYCNNHKPQLCDLKCFEEKDELLDFQTGPELRSKQKGLSKDSLTGEPIAEMILAKKTTRKQAYYQVINPTYCIDCSQHFHTQVLWLGQPQCNATWEPCSSLPPELIEDYETGIAREAAVETKFAYGHVVNTVTISKTEAHGEKRKRQERPCVENLQGYFMCTLLTLFRYSNIFPFLYDNCVMVIGYVKRTSNIRQKSSPPNSWCFGSINAEIIS